MYQKQLEIGRYKSITLLLPQRVGNSSFQSDKMNMELQSLYGIAIGSLTIQLGNFYNSKLSVRNTSVLNVQYCGFAFALGYSL